MTRVVATGAIPPVGHRAFSRIGQIEGLDETADVPRDAEVLLVRSRHVQDRDLAQADALRIIARTGSGVDNVDVSAAARRGIPVVFAPAAGARPVAEGAMALMLAAAKRLGELQGVLREGRWAERYEVEGLDLQGSVLGIVGFGEVGREVGRLARAFGMKIVAYDPHLPRGSADGAHLMPLADVVQRADVLSLHCPLTPQTRGMVDRDLIRAMKPGAILVNIARGEIVASDDLLIEALRSNQLSAVALDVFEREPPAPSSELFADPRVICSPHTIGLTRRWNERVFESLADDVAAYLRGEAPTHVVDRAALQDSMPHPR